jgi:hypothetical protein
MTVESDHFSMRVKKLELFLRDRQPARGHLAAFIARRQAIEPNKTKRTICMRRLTLQSHAGFTPAAIEGDGREGNWSAINIGGGTGLNFSILRYRD